VPASRQQEDHVVTNGERGPAPEQLVSLWINAVRRMDLATLQLFERRTWPTWTAESLEPVKQAIDARRKELGG
jgi:hypothetical protein